MQLCKQKFVRETETETDRDRQRDRETERDTETERETETETERQRDRENQIPYQDQVGALNLIFPYVQLISTSQALSTNSTKYCTVFDTLVLRCVRLFILSPLLLPWRGVARGLLAPNTS